MFSGMNILRHTSCAEVGLGKEELPIFLCTFFSVPSWPGKRGYGWLFLRHVSLCRVGLATGGHAPAAGMPQLFHRETKKIDRTRV
jgi:hypothetical protein